MEKLNNLDIIAYGRLEGNDETFCYFKKPRKRFVLSNKFADDFLRVMEPRRYNPNVRVGHCDIEFDKNRVITKITVFDPSAKFYMNYKEGDEIIFKSEKEG